MISINTNLSSMLATRNLSKSTDKIALAIERLSTGYKINHAGDNAAGSSIATNLSTQISSLMQVQNNTEDGINLLATAQGALENIDNLLDRLRNLSMQGLNGSYDEKSRQAMQEEANAIVAQIRSIRENTEFNGVKLFESASPASVLSSMTQSEGVNRLANSVSLNQVEPLLVPTSESEQSGSISPPKRLMTKSVKSAGLMATGSGSSDPIEGAVDFAASETKTVTIDGINYTIKNKNASANSLSYSKDIETGEITFMGNFFNITGQNGVQHNIAISGKYNYVYGGNLDDTLKIATSTSANNYLYGQGGNDTLINTVTSEYTYLYGGDGDDTFNGGGSYTYMYGNNGADTFNITKATYLEGNAGNDIININASSCTAYGGDGDDIFSITGSSNKVYGNAGEDLFTINSGSSNRVDGGAGTNSIVDNGTNSTTINVPGANTVITAESFAAGETKTIDIDGILYTITNNNTSTASFSYDIENDGRINFKSSKFKIVGQEDVAHKVRISASSTSFYGGELNDNIIIANVTSASAYGKGGDDTITLGGSYAYISAGDGNDNITVTSTNGAYSQIFAGAGDDTLTMSSGTGNAYINMGAGDDTVNTGSKYHLAIDGGSGNNTYTGTGNNVTYGFNEETDKLSESINISWFIRRISNNRNKRCVIYR